jgi:hypothetical protein
VLLAGGLGMLPLPLDGESYLVRTEDQMTIARGSRHATSS